MDAARQPAFDRLRGVLTLLVVWHHAAITYGAIGGWYYRELLPSGALSSRLLVFFCTVNQAAYFMGLFFLLAGYFTPASLRHKGPWRYLKERCFRLGVPLLVYGYLIGPMTIALARTAQGQPFAPTWWRLVRHAEFENGPLWFAQTLLILATCAALWFGSRADARSADAPGVALAAKTAQWPSDRALAWAALANGAAALALRSKWPVGVNVWGLQLGYFASYLVLFVFGCLAAHSHGLERPPPLLVRRWWRISLCTLPILPALYFASKVLPALQGGVMDVVYAFWEPLVAWGMVLKWLQWCQRTPATRQATWAKLSRRAYAIFVVHPPVLVGVALVWRDVSAPALLKFAVTGTLACALCWLLAGWVLRVPGCRRVL